MLITIIADTSLTCQLVANSRNMLTCYIYVASETGRCLAYFDNCNFCCKKGINNKKQRTKTKCLYIVALDRDFLLVHFTHHTALKSISVIIIALIFSYQRGESKK